MTNDAASRFMWDDVSQIVIVDPKTRLRVELKATQAQLEAGNYKKKHVKFAGFDVSIENEAGSTREGYNKKTGEKWSRHMHNDYGYIRRTEGVDGDHVDVYLGPNEAAEYVYVVHQVSPDTGKYDEDKCMLGFDSAEQAKACFLSHYDRPGFFGAMTIVPLELFRRRVFDNKGEQIVPDSHKRAEMKGTYVEEDHPRDENGRWAESESSGVRGVDNNAPFSLPAGTIIYHGTLAKAKDRIQADGLLSIKSQVEKYGRASTAFDYGALDTAGGVDLDSQVFVTTDKDVAIAYATIVEKKLLHGLSQFGQEWDKTDTLHWMLVEAELPADTDVRRDPNDSDALMLEGRIPPEWIKNFYAGKKYRGPEWISDHSKWRTKLVQMSKPTAVYALVFVDGRGDH